MWSKLYLTKRRGRAIYVLGNENRHIQGGENMYVSAHHPLNRNGYLKGWGWLGLRMAIRLSAFCLGTVPKTCQQTCQLGGKSACSFSFVSHSSLTHGTLTLRSKQLPRLSRSHCPCGNTDHFAGPLSRPNFAPRKRPLRVP